MRIDAEYRSIGIVYQFRILSLLCQTRGDVLPDADDTDDLAVHVSSHGGIEEHLNASTRLGNQRKFEVGGFDAGEAGQEYINEHRYLKHGH